MSNVLESVLRLQQLDDEISTLQEWIDALPLHLREIEKQLSDITQARDDAQKRIADNLRQRKQHDGEIQVLEQKISKYNNQLLDVKTNEEYRAFLKEIEFSRGEIKKIEDKILELMIAAESEEKQLKESDAELKRQQQDVDREKREAEADTKVKQQRLDALRAERQALVQGIDDTVMDLYGRIAKLRKGTVVAEARNQICSQCHVLIRPQTYNEVMRNTDIIQCSNCGRILYWVAPAEPTHSMPSGEPVRD